MNAEIGTETDAAAEYMWNFWDTSFKDQVWKGEDLAFCDLAIQSGFKLYANLDSWTTHHGTYGWRGKFGDSLTKKAKD
jgi:lysozyme family protein